MTSVSMPSGLNWDLLGGAASSVQGGNKGQILSKLCAWSGFNEIVLIRFNIFTSYLAGICGV